ncbi:MAG: methionine synthase [Candidatus Melainabacteria bacterium]
MTSQKSLHSSFFARTREKVLLFDGGLGTAIQRYDLTEDDFHGKDGCNEFLVETRPDVIRSIHAAYYEAGADVVETDTFGGTPLVLGEYDLAEKAYALNKAAAELARGVAKEMSTKDRPRFVAGSMGPTTKLPSLGHIRYADLRNDFLVQAEALVDGGVDMLLIETCQDLLQVKAALSAVHAVRRKQNRYIPTMVQVTIEQMGTMLVGMDIATVVTALQPYDIDVLGMNCATGPQEMVSHIRYLSQHSPFYISCLPNAGIPENVGGQAHYHLTPEALASHLQHFVKDFGVNIIGGCCGTTFDHIRALSAVVDGMTPAGRNTQFEYGATSLYTSVPYHLDPPPVLVGERTNANGSKLFRDRLAESDYDGLVSIGKEQIRKGAHMLDVCTAYVGRDELADMTETITRFNQQLDVPLVIDSTETPVLEAALQLIAGKAVVNSINLEDGEERLRAVAALCREFGAGVVALTIDEDGMAKTAERKLAIARRIHRLCVEELGMATEDLIFDPLTFTLGSGDEEFRKAGIETIEAIRRIEAALPGVSFILGISNISFGLKPAARHVLNSVFLHEAMAAGLNMAIINSAHMLPLHQISEQEKQLALDLIYDRRRFEGETCVYDPLTDLMAFYDANDGSSRKSAAESLPEAIEDRLKYRIINGEKTGLDTDLTLALNNYSALEIINSILLDGMKTVGELFGAGEMQLPFVLQSAEVMKTAVAFLEPHMDKSAGSSAKGKVVLATVKGDVHDIGKNLVDIILTNNGYTVYNLGIKQPLETITAAWREHAADAIGMSGLLVKSTAIMKENLVAMSEQGIDAPVILGGAALTPRFVSEDCQAVYGGRVYYAKDAFAGLHAMEAIMGRESAINAPKKELVSANGAATDNGNDEPVYQSVAELTKPGLGMSADDPGFAIRSSEVASDNPIPTPPFWGTRLIDDVDLADIYPFLNVQALVSGQWQVKRGQRTREAHEAFLAEKVYPTLEKLKAAALQDGLLKPKVIYGYFPAQSRGNQMVIYEPEPWAERQEAREWLAFDFPRGGIRKLCLADYIAGVDSGRMDVVAFQIVTVGHEATEYAQTLFQGDNYSDYLYFHGFSVEVAEALAECWHKRVRTELGIAGSDATDLKKLFAQGYQGSRYSPGYPACPRLEDQTPIFTLLQPERIGIALSEEFMLEPEQSTSAFIFHHPQARYFDVRGD